MQRGEHGLDELFRANIAARSFELRPIGEDSFSVISMVRGWLWAPEVVVVERSRFEAGEQDLDPLEPKPSLANKEEGGRLGIFPICKLLFSKTIENDDFLEFVPFNAVLDICCDY